MAPQTADSQRHHWMLPSSLKLRNLESLSLRNLRLNNPTTTSSSSTPHRTSDDSELPGTLNSPAKLLALHEAHALGHSRSSSDLRGENQQPNGSPKRPQARRLRRTSTMEWANATPQSRQRKLEAVMGERIGDVFFSLHVQGVEEPVYVSEVVEKSMNPSFGKIDWSGCGAGITRADEAVLRLWAKGGGGQDWVELLRLGVQLRGLVYLGESLANWTRPLPSNALLFHFPDGIYTPPTASLFPSPASIPPPPSETRPQRRLPTSTYSALLRLQKLTDTIQDALDTRNALAADLESLLQDHKQSLADQDSLSEAKDRLKTIEFAKSTVSKQLSKARALHAEKRASLDKRRELVKSDLAAREASTQRMADERPTFPALQNHHDRNEREIQSQRRRICEDLQFCYPILPFEGKTLAFTIRGLYLPNEPHMDAVPPEQSAAALGSIAHILQLLSFYLDQPLPYPVQPRGSTSTISDPISALKTGGKAGKGDVRIYPLFSKSVPRFRFDYAVFLISQDVRVVLESVYGLRTQDPRQILPNLKYLMVVATAGEGEVVGRKAGGIRGLMRRASQDSVRSGTGSVGASSGKNLGKAHARRVRGAEERLREISNGGRKGIFA